MADFTLDDVFADLRAEQQSTDFTLEDVIKDITPKEKPPFIQRVSSTLESARKELAPPIVEDFKGTLKNAP